MRMNGLHESNSKLNIRSYPKAKKTDSDLILLLFPPALCSSLSTFETLQCINHLRFIALSRSQVHKDILRISFYTPARVSLNVCESCHSPWMHLHITDIHKHISDPMCLDTHTHKHTKHSILFKQVSLKKMFWKRRIHPVFSPAVMIWVRICHSLPVARPHLLGEKVTGG